VGRATAINRWNADTDTETDGHLTLVLYGYDAALPGEVIDELAAAVGDASVSILTVHVIGADRPAVNINAGITVSAGYDETSTIEQCEAVLAEWLGWSNVGFGQTITPDAVEAILANVPGVGSALCATPAGDITHDLWELPAPGTITVHT
jgi:hypothetical protein